MKFTKMQGAGNDYVYVDCTKLPLANPSEVAVRVSDRHFGIGSDGLILIKPSDKADFFMEMYNADGSQGQMCGNGIRCVGKYVYDNGLTDKTTVNVETLAGIKILKLNVGDDGKVASVVVNMGKPELEASKVPVDVNALVEYKAAYRNTYKNDAILCPLAVKALDNVENAVINEAILVDGKLYDITGVSMGNPHDIVYLDNDIDITKFDIEKVGPYFENHKAFPERINTEFVQVLDRKTLNMRVWERGSGETFACGTGTCATVVATVLNGILSLYSLIFAGNLQSAATLDAYEMPLKTKNAYRTLPLSADAIDVLMQQRRKTGNSEWVFPSPSGGPMSPDSVLHMLHRVLKRAGLPKVRFHDLRHTFATLALQNGVDIKTVSGMLGHFSAGFTLDTYAHVTTSAKREAAKTMGSILSGAV